MTDSCLQSTIIQYHPAQHNRTNLLSRKRKSRRFATAGDNAANFLYHLESCYIPSIQQCSEYGYNSAQNTDRIVCPDIRLIFFTTIPSISRNLTVGKPLRRVNPAKQKKNSHDAVVGQPRNSDWFRALINYKLLTTSYYLASGPNFCARIQYSGAIFRFEPNIVNYVCVLFYTMQYYYTCEINWR